MADKEVLAATVADCSEAEELEFVGLVRDGDGHISVDTNVGEDSVIAILSCALALYTSPFDTDWDDEDYEDEEDA